MHKCIALAMLAATMSGCGSSPKQEYKDSAAAVPHEQSKPATTGGNPVTNKKDPVCDMPLHGHADDTMHYNGQVIGFCSKECMDEFRKKPAAYKIVFSAPGSQVIPGKTP